eukprot:GHVL01024141.1.p1 GENE.GHVL01024141.1~~GHVL01024141.1.p1  ORF type:complete len:101 (+),score=8.61 GHVL01024141.1:1282-1584(+)
MGTASRVKTPILTRKLSVALLSQHEKKASFHLDTHLKKKSILRTKREKVNVWRGGFERKKTHKQTITTQIYIIGDRCKLYSFQFLQSCEICIHLQIERCC